MTYTHTKHSPGFSRRGQIVAESNVHTIISAHFHQVYKLGDMASRGKTLTAMLAEFKERNVYFEIIFDAAHGKRYLLIAFMASGDADYDTRIKENQGARRQAFDFLSAPENTYYERFDA